MKCHHTSFEGKKVFIPGCWGGVIYGEYACTCRNQLPKTFEAFERKEYREKLKELQDQITELERENSRLNRIIRKLCNPKKTITTKLSPKIKFKNKF